MTIAAEQGAAHGRGKRRRAGEMVRSVAEGIAA